MNPSKLALAALAALSCAGSLSAQQNILYYPSNTVTTAKNAFPFGAARNGVRQQDLIPGSVFGMTPVLIQDIYAAHLGGIAAANTLTEGEIVYGDFEIRMGVTPVATLTSSWTTNLPNPTVVQKGRLRMRWKAGAFTPLGIQQPFLWLPTSASDNLCIDFILWNVQDSGGLIPDGNGYLIGCSFDATAQRAWLLNWPINQTGLATPGVSGARLGFLLGNGSFVGRGKGCPSSNSTTPATDTAGTWPKIGSSFQLQISSAGAAVPAFALLGTSELTWGATPLPFDLAIAGAPGCMVWTDPVVALPATVTTAAGAGGVSVAVPNVSGLMGGRLFATWATLDPLANPFGIVTSDYGLLILGQ